MAEDADMQKQPSAFREKREAFRWEGVEHLPYKEEGSAPFKDISRQVLVQDPDLDCELRYFEMAPGGHSTLERHQHVHGVMILRGRGHCMVGQEVREVGERDLVTIPPMAWHQFRASRGEAFGFLCMVNVARDKPQLPTDEDMAAMRADARVADFLDWKFD